MLKRIRIFCNGVLDRRISLWIYDISLFLCFCLLFFVWEQELSALLSAEDESSVAEGGGLTGPARAELARRLHQLNAELRVHNEEQLGSLAPRAPVLVLAARGGRARLRRLLGSLRRAPDVYSALLVVSHTVYDDEVDRLVRGVRFCRVLQLFYPYSLQLFPDRFPGPAACAGAPCPPRDAAAAEDKHHWWWTARFLFDRYLIENGHTGPVLFLQEDEYVLPDVLHMLQYAVRAFAYHPGADVVSLGRPYLRDQRYDILTLQPWRPPLDRGLAFNSSVWRRIAPLASRYCTYDDASWSYSLLNVFAGLPRGYAEAVVSDAPRVMRGAGGGEGGGAGAGAALFPAIVHSALLATPRGRASERMRPPPRGAGGWRDLRDHRLCLAPDLLATTASPINTFAYGTNRTSG